MHDQNVGGCVVHPLHLPSLSVTIRRPFFPSSVWGNNYHMLPFQPPFQFSPSPVPWLFPFLQELGGAGFIPLDTVCIRILPPFPNPACMKIGFEASQNQSSYTWLGGARIIPLDTVCIRILPPFPNPACMKIGFEASQNQSSYTWLGGARIIPLDTELGASIHPFDFQLDSTVLSLLSTFSPLSISLSLPSGQSIHRPCIHDFISLNDLTKQTSQSRYVIASLPSAPLSLLRLSPFCASLPSAPLSLLRLSPFCASLPSAPLSLLRLSPFCASLPSAPLSLLLLSPVTFTPNSFLFPPFCFYSAGPFRSAGSAQLASPAGSSQGEGSFEKSPTPFHCIPLLLPLQIQQAPFALLGAPNSPPLLAAVGAMDPSLLQKGGLLIVGPEGGEMRVSFEMPARLFSTRPTVLHHPQPRSTPTLQLLGLRAAAGSRAVHSAGGRNQWVASIGQSNPI
ncbi:unnamed protein product [Closterium sp. NIES-64]|nr:unnamed protein product [Closterium sp. NIES-64]